MLRRILASAGLFAALLHVAPVGAQGAGPSPNLLRATVGVPVFLAVNAAGNPLISTPPEGGSPIVAFFLRRGMADSYVAGIRANKAEFAATLKIQVAQLSDLLRSQPANRTFELAFVADPAEVDNAVRELTAQGKPATLAGVPVFLLRSPSQGYVTITLNGRSVIPAFLGFGEVAALRDQVRGMAGPAPAVVTTVIEVTTLETLLSTLQTSTDPMFQNLLLQASGAAVAEAR